MPLEIDIDIEAEAWRGIEAIEVLTRKAVAAVIEMADAGVEDDAELSLLLCDDARIKSLNRGFRGIDEPTNVLSFPAPDMPGQAVLGDIAIAYETVAREAAAEGKTISDHYTHMVAHGLLHILGYDHETDAEAEEMEALERVILARLGIADPYGPEEEDNSTP